jgi:hypothetical protein
MTLCLQEYVTRNGIAVLPQPPNSPDLVPASTTCSQGWKPSRKGSAFQSPEDVKHAMKAVFREAVRKYFTCAVAIWLLAEMWQRRSKSCHDDRWDHKRKGLLTYWLFQVHAEWFKWIHCEYEPKWRWKDGIRMDLREFGWGSVEWIQLAQDRGQWRALVNTMINMCILAPWS